MCQKVLKNKIRKFRAERLIIFQIIDPAIPFVVKKFNIHLPIPETVLKISRNRDQEASKTRMTTFLSFPWNDRITNNLKNNTYLGFSFPGMRWTNSNTNFIPQGVFHCANHRLLKLYLSFFSRTYFSIGAPPSNSGAVHFKVTLSLS